MHNIGLGVFRIITNQFSFNYTVYNVIGCFFLYKSFFMSSRYDLSSVMHYNQYAFSTGLGVVSIKPKEGSGINGNDLGQREGFSKIDAAQIRAAYVRVFHFS